MTAGRHLFNNIVPRCLVFLWQLSVDNVCREEVKVFFYIAGHNLDLAQKEAGLET